MHDLRIDVVARFMMHYDYGGFVCIMHTPFSAGEYIGNFATERI